VLVGEYLLLVEYQGLKKMRVKIFARDEEGLNLRAIRVGNFDIGENLGCRPVVAAGNLYSVTETGMLKIHGVNVRSEDAPLFPAAEQWPVTSLAGEYALLPDTEASPFKKGISNQNAVLVCGNGLAVYQFNAPERKAEEVWRFPPGGASEKVIPGEAYLPPQRVGNLVCVATIAPDRDGAFLTAIDLEQKDMAWQVAAGAAAGAPVVDQAGGRIFVRNALGSVYSISEAVEGQRPKILDKPLVAARTATDCPVPAPYYVSSSPGRLYVGLADNALHAVDAESGAPIPGWEEPFRTQSPGGPLAPLGKGALVFGTTQGGVFVASLANAKTYCQEFNDPARHSYALSPLVGPDGAIYIGNSRGFFYKLAMAEQSGQRYLKTEARFKASGPISAGAAPAGEAVFVGDANGALYALAARTLNPTREWPLGVPITCDLASNGSTVFAASEAGCVYAVSVQQKTPLWRFPKEGFVAAVKGKPLTLGQYVLVGTEDGKVYALRCETGEPVWTHDVGSGISASLALMGRRLVAPCRDGSVKLVDLPKEVSTR
jgi:outer membrane protein assembly factor BamB